MVDHIGTYHGTVTVLRKRRIHITVHFCFINATTVTAFGVTVNTASVLGNRIVRIGTWSQQWDKHLH
jgi:hypothetical protein